MSIDGSRHRDWEGFANARTLEGIPTASGPIRPGRLFRSDAPSCTADVGLAALAAEGISTVLDLRSADELDRSAGAFIGSPVHRSTPLVDPAAVPPDDLQPANTLLEIYRDCIDRNGRTFGVAVQEMVSAPPGGVLVHCAAGKDRTGMLVAVALSALGAPREAIVADYAETEDRLADYFARELAHLRDPVSQQRLASLQQSPPATMHGTLDHLEREYGGSAAYLFSHGVTAGQLGRLAQRLTGDVAAPTC